MLVGAPVMTPVNFTEPLKRIPDDVARARVSSGGPECARARRPRGSRSGRRTRWSWRGTCVGGRTTDAAANLSAPLDVPARQSARAPPVSIGARPQSRCHRRAKWRRASLRRGVANLSRRDSAERRLRPHHPPSRGRHTGGRRIQHHQSVFPGGRDIVRHGGGNSRHRQGRRSGDARRPPGFMDERHGRDRQRDRRGDHDGGRANFESGWRHSRAERSGWPSGAAKNRDCSDRRPTSPNISERPRRRHASTRSSTPTGTSTTAPVACAARRFSVRRTRRPFSRSSSSLSRTGGSTVRHRPRTAAWAIPTAARSTGAGLPGIGTVQDPIDYDSTTWHTNLDTYERVVPDDAMKDAVITASVAYHLANREAMLPRFSSATMPALPPGRGGGRVPNGNATFTAPSHVYAITHGKFAASLLTTTPGAPGPPPTAQRGRCCRAGARHTRAEGRRKFYLHAGQRLRRDRLVHLHRDD